jgi:hypothetical protein
LAQKILQKLPPTPYSRVGTPALQAPHTFSGRRTPPLFDATCTPAAGQRHHISNAGGALAPSGGTYIQLQSAGSAPLLPVASWQAGSGVADQSLLVPWFAVAAELLGDIVRLAMHEAELCGCHAAAGRDGVPFGGVPGSGEPGALQRQLAFEPHDLLLDLDLADLALAALGEALCQQVATSAASRRATGQQQGQHAPRAVGGSGFMHASHSTTSLAEVGASGSGGGARAGASAAVDVRAAVEALAGMLLRPRADVDTLFTLMMLDKAHVLTGARVLAPLCVVARLHH